MDNKSAEAAWEKIQEAGQSAEWGKYHDAKKAEFLRQWHEHAARLAEKGCPSCDPAKLFRLLGDPNKATVCHAKENS
jgi:hypothetical protein